MKRPRILSFASRDPRETHRSSTSLELIFDLAAVIAIAAAAHGLAHAIETGHAAEGVVAFLGSFFMIWWAWMNHSWFASAYDDNSTGFRLLTMVIMFGALMLAAGIGAAFAQQRIWLALLGFVVMRIGMAVLWLGAARGDPAHRPTALRYARGIVAMQGYWVALVVLVPPDSVAYVPLLALGAAGELAVPALAERRGATSWHRGHMIERYGGLNIIVLAEIFLAITAMIQIEGGGALPEAGPLWLAVMSAVIAFSLWGLYFTEEGHLSGEGLRRALLWGYGHFMIFAAGAATGAGLTVMLAVVDHTAHVTPRVGAIAVAAPVAVYVATLWLIRDRICVAGAGRWLLPGVAGLVLLAGLATPWTVELVAILLGAAALCRRRLVSRAAPAATPSRVAGADGFRH